MRDGHCDSNNAWLKAVGLFENSDSVFDIGLLRGCIGATAEDEAERGVVIRNVLRVGGRERGGASDAGDVADHDVPHLRGVIPFVGQTLSVLKSSPPSPG